MDVDVACPQCGTLFTIKRELLGKRSKCTKCGTVFTLAEGASRPATHRPDAPSPSASSVFSDTPSTPHVVPVDIPQINIDTTPRTVQPQPQVQVQPPQPPRPQQQESAGAYLGFEPETTQPRFPALRIVARAYEILAVVAFAFAALMLVLFVIGVVRSPTAFLPLLITSGMATFWACAAAVSMLFVAQMIRLGLQIEQNTRESSAACRQLADHLCSIETER